MASLFEEPGQEEVDLGFPEPVEPQPGVGGQQGGNVAVTDGVPGEGTDEFLEPLQDGSGVTLDVMGEFGGAAVEDFLGRGVEDGVLGGEVIEEGGFADPEPIDDVLDSGLVEPAVNRPTSEATSSLFRAVQ